MASSKIAATNTAAPHAIPYLSPTDSAACGTKGNKTTPAAGIITPAINKNKLEASAKMARLITASCCMGARLNLIPSTRDQVMRNRLVVCSCERQKCNGARPFYSRRQYPLMASAVAGDSDRKSTRLNSSHGYISYAV